ncbi:MAG: histidinol dehydrogenase, partial [Melioribacteraceae bacterium]|nr:histidinol dehydrogenase [Melioribacteraceae bacterium]
MKSVNYKALGVSKKRKLLERPSVNMSKSFSAVKPILEEVKKNGLTGALKYARMFDGFKGKRARVSISDIENSEHKVSNKYKRAVKTAVKNIERFHINQRPKKYLVETMPGIKCSREFKAIENVGLYIPGGTALLPSTLMMLAVPALIAGCKRIVVCTPSDKDISPEILYVAKFLEIQEIYKLGGAQAIGLMAYGSGKIKKVDKIFGPGNQFVTAAKALVSIDPKGCAIDMIAGPSEVLIIADESAKADFVAA